MAKSVPPDAHLPIDFHCRLIRETWRRRSVLGGHPKPANNGHLKAGQRGFSMSLRVSYCGDIHIEEERYFGDTAHCLEWYVADSIHSNASLFVVNGDLTTYKATSQRDRDPRARAVLQFGPCNAQRCGFPLFGLRDTCGAQRGKMLSAPLSLTCSQRSQLPSWRRFDQSNVG